MSFWRRFEDVCGAFRGFASTTSFMLGCDECVRGFRLFANGEQQHGGLTFLATVSRYSPSIICLFVCLFVYMLIVHMYAVPKLSSNTPGSGYSLLTASKS